MRAQQDVKIFTLFIQKVLNARSSLNNKKRVKGKKIRWAQKLRGWFFWWWNLEVGCLWWNGEHGITSRKVDPEMTANFTATMRKWWDGNGKKQLSDCFLSLMAASQVIFICQGTVFVWVTSYDFTSEKNYYTLSFNYCRFI